MTFDQLRAAPDQQPAVALFYGAACAPCERLKPVLRQVCASLKVPLHEFNSAGELPALKSLGVRSVPAVFVIRHGEARAAFTGALDAESIREKFALHGIVSAADMTLVAS